MTSAASKLFTMIIAGVLATMTILTPGPLAAAESDAALRARWIDKLLAARDHKTVAFNYGPHLMALDAGDALAIAETAWPKITTNEVKTALLKSFAFGRHPGVLRVLHLGMCDADAAVRSYAESYLRPLAMRCFDADRKAYLAWYARNGGKPLDEVFAEGYASLAAELKTLDPAAGLALLQKIHDDFGCGANKTTYPEKRAIVERSGLAAILAGWLDMAELTPRATVDILKILAKMSPSQALLDKTIAPLAAAGHPLEVRLEAMKLLYTAPAADREAILKALQETLRAALASDPGQCSQVAMALGKLGDPRAIPLMIAVIDADNSYDTVYGVGYFGLHWLTGVGYDAAHDGPWWRQWWAENRKRFPTAAAMDIPTLPTRPSAAPAAKGQAFADIEIPADLRDVPALDLCIGGEADRRYFLIGPVDGEAPPEGFKLAVILPGGDGGASFHPFVRRIFKHALGPGWLVAQPVAVKWRADQQIVWPTQRLRVASQKFSTEQFVEAVVADVKARCTIDPRRVFTMSWSSSGPAAYAVSLQERTAVTGSYVAMSVFKPAVLGPLARAKGRLYYIEHSPRDAVCPYRFAQAARQRLAAAGAKVEAADYPGGHGWRGDLYGRIRRAMAWLDRKAGEQ